jgi:hypothetical protein
MNPGGLTAELSRCDVIEVTRRNETVTSPQSVASEKRQLKVDNRDGY